MTDCLLLSKGDFIQIINTDGTINTAPFLDIDASVSNAGGERGLLAMAFHPNYTNNGFFYVNYIDNAGETVISRFTRNTDDTADANSELVLLSISQPFSNHNGGDLHFGADGYLYISLGDGGSGGDPGNRAQTLTTYLGKMLRIDVDNTSDGNNYAIPADNPFVGNNNVLEEIWAYGLRNPFKFSFDSANGNLWIADVGQNQIEEINRVTSTAGGENYGWKCFEGTSVFSTENGCDIITQTPPVAEYIHSNGRCSITGGYVYRGTAFPNLQGSYFFADFCTNEIGFVQEIIPDTFETTFFSNLSISGPSAFGEDINGQLYIAGVNDGNISKIVETNLSLNDQSFSTLKIYPNPSNATVTFDNQNGNLSLASISIYDLQGKLAMSISEVISDKKTISTTQLKSGFYLAEIEDTEGNRLIKKLIIN